MGGQPTHRDAPGSPATICDNESRVGAKIGDVVTSYHRPHRTLPNNDQTIVTQQTNTLVGIKAINQLTKERPMAQAAIITPSEGLREPSRKARNPTIIADLWLATCYSRALAALKIEAEAQGETDPGRR